MRRGRDPGTGARAHLIEGGLPTEGALAHVLVSKYADHLPLYRQSQILARAGIHLHRSTLADWVGTAAFHLGPVVDRLSEHLKRSEKLSWTKPPLPCWTRGGGEQRRDISGHWRAMTFKFTGGVSAFKDKLVTGMVARGYDPDFAERTFRQLEGFGSYGFPESHAASFALIAYASAWLKCWHPDVFCAALLNSQPMGFYAPAQIVRDARDHGVEIRPICVNASRWDCTLEPAEDETRFAVRLGLGMVKGLANAHAGAIVLARADQPFASIDDVWQRAGVPVAALTRIAEADGFRPAFGLALREALWTLKGLRDAELPLFAAASARAGETAAETREPAVVLRPMAAGREVVEDYRHAGLSLRRHSVSFLRADLIRRRITTCAEERAVFDGVVRSAIDAAQQVRKHWDFSAPAKIADREIARMIAPKSEAGKQRLRRAFVAAACLEQTGQFIQRLPDSVLSLYPRFYARMADYLKSPEVYTDDDYAKDVRYAENMLVPARLLAVDLNQEPAPSLSSET